MRTVTRSKSNIQQKKTGQNGWRSTGSAAKQNKKKFTKKELAKWIRGVMGLPQAEEEVLHTSFLRTYIGLFVFLKT